MRTSNIFAYSATNISFRYLGFISLRRGKMPQLIYQELVKAHRTENCPKNAPFSSLWLIIRSLYFDARQKHPKTSQ